MVSICCTKELKTFTNYIIFNLAISDLFISAVINLFTTVGI